MDQPSLLPPSLEELIPKDHLVRVVNRMMEELDLELILNEYKGGGTSSYHPRLMLKVLVYAYTYKVNSSQQIAKGLRENVNFMWISGNNRPDFQTINRFRSSVMKEGIKVVFSKVLEALIDEGYVTLENFFLDGTKIEANANNYKGCGRRVRRSTRSACRRRSRRCSGTSSRRIKQSRKQRLCGRCRKTACRAKRNMKSNRRSWPGATAIPRPVTMPP